MRARCLSILGFLLIASSSLSGPRPTAASETAQAYQLIADVQAVYWGSAGFAAACIPEPTVTKGAALVYFTSSTFWALIARGAQVYNAVVDPPATAAAMFEAQHELSAEPMLSDIVQAEIDPITGELLTTTSPVVAASPGTTVAIVGTGFSPVLEENVIFFDEAPASVLSTAELEDGQQVVFTTVPFRAEVDSSVSVFASISGSKSNSLQFRIVPPRQGGGAVDRILEKWRQLLSEVATTDWTALINVEATIDGVSLTDAEVIAAQNAADAIVATSQLSVLVIDEIKKELDAEDRGFVRGRLQASLVEESLDVGLTTLQDSDEDGLPDIRDEDNCPQVTNPDLPDLDGDGIADVCEDMLLSTSRVSASESSIEESAAELTDEDGTLEQMDEGERITPEHAGPEPVACEG